MDLNYIFDKISNYLNLYYLFTFIFLGYLIKEYFRVIVNSLFNMLYFFVKKNIFRKKIIECNNKEISMVHIILILAMLVAIPFLLTGVDWQKILLSYTVGTSLHETIFTFIERKAKQK